MRFIAFMAAILAFGAMLAFSFTGCKGNQFLPQPLYNATNTFTVTGTASLTQTTTLTFTPTITLTVTNTPTPTITNTVCVACTETDTLTITLTPTSTATRTPIPGWVFSAPSSIAGWYYNASGSVGGGVTTTATLGFNGSASCLSNTGALEVTIGFTGANQQVNIQYALGVTMNMAGKNISAVVSVPSGFASSNPQGGYVYLQNGGPNWSFYKISTWTDLSSGCVTLAMVAPTTTQGSFDPTQVILIGFEFVSNSTGPTSTTIVDIFNWLYQ
jgi:hypothetical protein